MGLSIADLLAISDDLNTEAIWTRHPDKLSSALLSADTYVGSDLDNVLGRVDVIIDFSLPAGTEQVVPAAAAVRVPVVCGVSGLDARQMQMLSDAASEIPLLYDRNMSRGIAVLEKLVRDAARALGPEFEVRIEETHHLHKKDAPSGTALKLGEAAAEARGLDFDAVRYYPPESGDREPPADRIEFHAERRGEVPGDHSVSFACSSEKLVLSHSVTSRDVFARGAVAAARWLPGRPAGLYSMQDLLFEAN